MLALLYNKKTQKKCHLREMTFFLRE